MMASESPRVAVPRVASLLAGAVRTHRDGQGEWSSAVEKSPLAGPARITRSGLEGDQQADTRHHGGPDKALLAWSAARTAEWSRRLGRPLAPGCFGENLFVEGLDECEVRLGDRWALCPPDLASDADPPADAPVLEVSQPRQPCWKPGRLLGESEAARLMAQLGHTGWYLRVLAGGRAEAGARLVLLHRPHPDWTILRCWQAWLSRDTHPAEWRELRLLPELAEAWRS
jgi:MOSC domain-containing protein YiiM